MVIREKVLENLGMSKLFKDPAGCHALRIEKHFLEEPACLSGTRTRTTFSHATRTRAHSVPHSTANRHMHRHSGWDSCQALLRSGPAITMVAIKAIDDAGKLTDI